MIKIQKSKFVGNIQFREFDQSEPGRKIKFLVCFHPVGYFSFSKIDSFNNHRL